ncbi:14448_t:CDS:2, partial [Entrophospora sp. SA101]
MTDIDNFFLHNRKENHGKLYFKVWLPQVFFPTVELLKKSVLDTAVKRYNNELNTAITICENKGWKSVVKKLEQISNYFSLMTREKRQEIFSEAYQVEKKRREEHEKQQNQEIIRNNIAEIVDKCINAVNIGRSFEIEEVIIEVRECLEQLDLSSIDSSDPIASGILDIAEGVDGVADKLTVGAKEILNEVELSEPGFSEKTDVMLDEFINGYSLLGPDFDPALANPISFPRDENNLGVRRILLTTFDLLEGLEKVADSSQTRKEMMHSVQSGDRPDLQDGIDIRFGKLFKGKDIECADAKILIDELLQLPFIGIQVISNRVIVFGIDFYNNSFYRSFKIREYTIPLRVSD